MAGCPGLASARKRVAGAVGAGYRMCGTSGRAGARRGWWCVWVWRKLERGLRKPLESDIGCAGQVGERAQGEDGAEGTGRNHGKMEVGAEA
jgi:hypothetical protein